MATKSVLIVSESHLIKTFLIPTISHIKLKGDVKFDCLIVSPLSEPDNTFHSMHFDNIISNEFVKGRITQIRKIKVLFSLFNLMRIAKNLDSYDVIHINYHHWYFSLIMHILRLKSNRLIISFFGSDFNQIGYFHHYCNKWSISKSDAVCASNPHFLARIFEYYNLNRTVCGAIILRPIMASFNNFDNFFKNISSYDAKVSFKLKSNVITCGYNGAKIVRHDLIWNSLSNIKPLLGDYSIIFPVTYGNGRDEVIKYLENNVQVVGLDIKIIKDFLNFDELARLRRATDIFIHIQQRDQLASSVLEFLAAGAVAIIGRWLPYEILLERGIYAVWINSPDELTTALDGVLTNLDYHKRNAEVNKDIVLDLVAWENIKRGWADAYKLSI